MYSAFLFISFFFCNFVFLSMRNSCYNKNKKLWNNVKLKQYIKIIWRKDKPINKYIFLQKKSFIVMENNHIFKISFLGPYEKKKLVFLINFNNWSHTVNIRNVFSQINNTSNLPDAPWLFFYTLWKLDVFIVNISLYLTLKPYRISIIIWNTQCI